VSGYRDDSDHKRIAAADVAEEYARRLRAKSARQMAEIELMRLEEKLERFRRDRMINEIRRKAFRRVTIDQARKRTGLAPLADVERARKAKARARQLLKWKPRDE
jgi:hypothetical protein